MVNEEQRQTRRHALGRKLLARASGLTIDLKGLQDSPDLAFLSESERKALDKQLEVMGKVIRNFNTLGDRLDKGQ